VVQSACGVATPIEFPLAIRYATLLAPVERWLGSFRWIVVAAIGHVGATLLVAMLIWAMVKLGWVGDEATRGVDVGVSYAFGAVAGVFAYLLRGRLRRLYPAALLGVFALVLIVAPSFTAVGHLLAILIGLALGWLLQRRVPLPAAAAPLYPRPLWRP
ncbi:MAG: rhomboid-like protein, partial [Gaiellales bacterium]